MDSSPSLESSLLQQRLQLRKRSAIPPLDTTLHNHQSPGRDDAIFDNLDDLRQPSRKPSGPLYMSSPITAGSSRPVQGRHTSYMSPSTASSARSMGVREMDNHVDKLSKENFDLKLRLYKSQERSQGLEKRIQELEQVKADNDELADINNGLMQELETYDRAVDEAVVKICDLEGKIRDLQDQLDDLRPQTATQQSSAPSVAQFASHQRSSTPLRQRRRTSSLGDTARLVPNIAVTSDVSEPLAVLATPRVVQASRNPPSFLDQSGADTKALRSLFKDGERSIRPLPSRETLLSEVDEADVLRSPAQSMLSETEFRSIYGDRSVSPDRRRRVSTDGNHESPPRELLPTDRSRLARTNRWVNDRSTSPALHRPKPVRQPSAPPFQSLGSVLQADEELLPTAAMERSTRRITDGQLANQLVHQNPIFGRHNFPPTPDTMLTHPSTHSSASVVKEQSSMELPKHLSKAFQSTVAGDLHGVEFLSGGSMLPKELDLYASDSDGEHSPVHLENTTFGKSLFQPDGYNSDESVLDRQSSGNPFMATNLFEARHARPSSASPNSAGSPRLSSIPFRTLNHITFESPPLPPVHKRSTSATPTQTSVARPRPHSDFEPLPPGFNIADLAFTPVKKDAPLPPPHTDGPFIKRAQASSERRPTTPKATDGSADIAEQTASAPSRADMIRQRVAKFGRRSRTSQDSTPRPSSSGASRYGRTKQFFRRNSNSQAQPTSPKSPSRARRNTRDTDDEDDDTPSKAAFMSAAQAAAPYLDLLGNTRKEPIRGINTGIPIHPSMMTPQKVPQGTSGSLSPAESSVQTRRASGMKLFPRRGKDGEEVMEQQQKS